VGIDGYRVETVYEAGLLESFAEEDLCAALAAPRETT
jgi:hypothetical protein